MGVTLLVVSMIPLIGLNLSLFLDQKVLQTGHFLIVAPLLGLEVGLGCHPRLHLGLLND